MRLTSHTNSKIENIKTLNHIISNIKCRIEFDTDSLNHQMNHVGSSNDNALKKTRKRWRIHFGSTLDVTETSLCRIANILNVHMRRESVMKPTKVRRNLVHTNV